MKKIYTICNPLKNKKGYKVLYLFLWICDEELKEIAETLIKKHGEIHIFETSQVTMQILKPIK